MADSSPEPALGPACTDVRCDWVSVPHVHEGVAVYPLPPDRPEWFIALAADEEADRVRPSVAAEYPSPAPDADSNTLAEARDEAAYWRRQAIEAQGREGA